MIIPSDSLSPEVLRNIVESFVLREGTDYGEQEVSFNEKVEQVLEQIKNKEVLVQYSELHDTVDLVSCNDVQSS